MYVEKIKFTDFEGNPGVKTIYFNLNKMEVVNIQWSVPGGIKQLFEKIVEEQDIQKILLWMEEILSKAYGIKSDDGKRFMKPADGWLEFKEGPAYDDWMFDVIRNPNKAAAIMRAIMPAIEAMEAAPTKDVSEVTQTD